MARKKCKQKNCHTKPHNDKYKGYCSKHKHLMTSGLPDEAKNALKTLSELGITVNNPEEQYNINEEAKKFENKGLKPDEIDLLQKIEDYEIKNYAENAYLNNFINNYTFKIISYVEPYLDEEGKEIFRNSIIHEGLMKKIEPFTYGADELTAIIESVSGRKDATKAFNKGIDLLVSLDDNETYRLLDGDEDFIHRLTFSQAYHNDNQPLDTYAYGIDTHFSRAFCMSKAKKMNDEDFQKLTNFSKDEVGDIIEAFNDSYSEERGEYLLGDSDYGDLSDSVVERLNMDTIDGFCYHGGDLSFESAALILVSTKRY